MNYIDEKDTIYSFLFNSYSNAPQRLYYLGDIGILQNNITAVIGKRDTNLQKLAYQIGRQVSVKDNVLLNGLAIGCDGYAVQGALSNNGKVISVLPCGINYIYPKCHEKIAHQILDNGGCIVSQFEPDFQVTKYSFVERDRIQAIIANKVLVVDSEVDGGTMQTVKYAKKYGKTLGCYNDTSGNTPKGNEHIINEFHACSISNIEELDGFLKLPTYHQMCLF